MRAKSSHDLDVDTRSRYPVKGAYEAYGTWVKIWAPAKTLFFHFLFFVPRTHTLTLHGLGSAWKRLLGFWFHLGLKTRVARRLDLDVQPLISKSVGSKVVTVIAERCGKCFTKSNNIHSLLTLYLHFKVDFCILGRLQIPKMSASKKIGNLSRNGSFDRLASEFNEQVCGPEFGKIPGTSLTTGDFEAEPLAL